MKKLSLKNAESLLSRKEMKAINGGYGGYGSSTTCYGSSKVCYTDSAGTQYTCSGPAQPQSEEDCCCNHYLGNNDICIMG